MGSGTTASVAKRLNRNYVGIELNPEYHGLIYERLDKTARIKPLTEYGGMNMATIGEYLLELHYWLYDTPIPLRVKITIEKAYDVVCKYGFYNSTPNDKLDFLGDLSKWLINNDMNNDAIHVLMAKHLILKYVLGD